MAVVIIVTVRSVQARLDSVDTSVGRDEAEEGETSHGGHDMDSQVPDTGDRDSQVPETGATGDGNTTYLQIDVFRYTRSP